MKKFIVSLVLTCLSLLVIGQEIIIYPNPAPSGIFTIEARDTLLPPIIKLYNMAGRLVMKVDIGEGNSSVVLNISHLSRGAYLVVFEAYKKKRKYGSI